MSPIAFSSYSVSNSLGAQHLENQDSYLTDRDQLLFAVADGVGGYLGAKEASELAIKGLKERAFLISDESSFHSVLKEIHEEIKERANRLHHENMGTTIAVAKVIPDDDNVGTVITANVGDSPILFFPVNPGTGERCKKAYTDDSHRDEDSSSIFGIIQYLGLPECEIEVHTSRFRYETGDILLLCSDGVTDNLVNRDRKESDSWNQIAELVRDGRSAQKLTELAIAAGIKPDDMTAILVLL